MKKLFCLAAVATIISFGCSHKSDKYNLGIGVYPGNPYENSAPVMVQDDSYRNIALHRASYASSSYDYNLTAQLVTDGIVSAEMPRFLQVSTPEGGVPRREREWLVDQGPYTRPIFEGSSTSIVFELGNGWKEMADNVRMLGYVNFLEEEADGSYEISFYGSENGEEWDKIGEFSGKNFPGEKLSPRKHSDPDKSAALGERLLPRRLIDLNVNLESPKSYSFFRVSLNMPGAQEWMFTNCDFYYNDNLVNLVSSQFFCSTWMSYGSADEWLYVDLGTEAKFDKVVMHWLNRPAYGVIEVSKDGAVWKKTGTLAKGGIAAGTEEIGLRGKGRYVRVSMSPAADGKPAAAPPFDIAKFAGIFAAIGMAVGMIGTALVSLAKGIFALKWWQLILAFVGIMLLISGPAMIMAWMKLRRRNIAPLLNANGWAINAASKISIPFGESLTEIAKFPVIKLKDPYAKKGIPVWKRWVISIASLLVVLAVLWLVNLFAWAKLPSPLPWFDKNEPVVEEVVETVETVVVEEVAE